MPGREGKRGLTRRTGSFKTVVLLMLIPVGGIVLIFLWSFLHNALSLLHRSKLALADLVIIDPPSPTGPDIAQAIRAAEQQLNGNGRINVRYSGTESLARVMVEAESEETVKKLAQSIAAVIEVELGVGASAGH